VGPRRREPALALFLGLRRDAAIPETILRMD